MLVLTRKVSQQILIGSDITITVVRIEGNHVRLGIEAPAGVSILREELVTHQEPNDVRPTAQPGRQAIRAV
jgi:carbon storage regulator